MPRGDTIDAREGLALGDARLATTVASSIRRSQGAPSMPVIALGAFVSIAAFLASPESASAESVYTKLDLDACTTLEADEDIGYVAMVCPGYKNAPVFFSEGDLRQDVDFGVSNGAFDTFGPFNNVHHTIEWLIIEGQPQATVHRYFVSDGNGDGTSNKQALLVSKVGTPREPGCAMAVVDVASNEQPNAVARGVAAMAPIFTCATDATLFVGDSGMETNSFTRSDPLPSRREP